MQNGALRHGARYLDHKTSLWISVDPAVENFISNDYRSSSGGIFNTVNFNLYHYSGNNPITYKDPNGNDFKSFIFEFGRGIKDSAVNDVEGLKNVVLHPVQSASDAYNSVKDEVASFYSNPSEYIEQKINAKIDAYNQKFENSLNNFEQKRYPQIDKLLDVFIILISALVSASYFMLEVFLTPK